MQQVGPNGPNLGPLKVNQYSMECKLQFDSIGVEWSSYTFIFFICLQPVLNGMQTPIRPYRRRMEQLYLFIFYLLSQYSMECKLQFHPIGLERSSYTIIFFICLASTQWNANSISPLSAQNGVVIPLCFLFAQPVLNGMQTPIRPCRRRMEYLYLYVFYLLSQYSNGVQTPIRQYRRRMEQLYLYIFYLLSQYSMESKLPFALIGVEWSNYTFIFFICLASTQWNANSHSPLKVGFHYPSSRAEFTDRVDGPRTRVHFLTPVNSGRELGQWKPTLTVTVCAIRLKYGILVLLSSRKVLVLQDFYKSLSMDYKSLSSSLKSLMNLKSLTTSMSYSIRPE